MRIIATSDIFTALRGVWLFSRKVINNDTKTPLGSVAGSVKLSDTANNAASNDELHYEENGEFIVSNFTNDQHITIKVSREYMFSYDSRSDAISKYFYENKQRARLFYTLRLQQLNCPTLRSQTLHSKTLSVDQTINAYAEHVCESDIYKAHYEFTEVGLKSELSLDKFKLTYVVIGPKKNYTSATTYTRDSYN